MFCIKSVYFYFIEKIKFEGLKFTLKQAMKTQRESKGITTTSLTSVLEGGGARGGAVG
jgi:hypothetical protein